VEGQVVPHCEKFEQLPQPVQRFQWQQPSQVRVWQEL
jgi:hypothetical protein